MGVRREGWRCVSSTGHASSAGTMMKYGEFLVSTVSMNENDGVTQRVITITDPKIITTLVHLQLCTSLIHVYTTISLVRFKK